MLRRRRENVIFTLRESFDADVIVVGAGPAGAATATHLARGGMDTLVVERGTFPRDKVCGDFLSPTALWELLALSDSLALGGTNAVTTAALYLDGSLLVEQALPAGPLPPLGRVVPRRELDAAIAAVARDAGARFLEGTSVTGVERSGRSVAVEVSGRPRRILRARVVVGADGSNSLVGRIVRGGRVPRGDRIIALRGYFDEVAGPPGRAELFFSHDSFPGYCWVFPTEPGVANVGIGMLLETFPAQTTHLRELLSRLLATDPAVRRTLGRARPISKLVGWPLTTYNPRLPLADNGLLLVGDAAGLINPINGEGIQYALASGRWAAEVLLAAARDSRFSHADLEPYERRVSTELRLDMALARVVSRLIANRVLNPLWLVALRAITDRAASDSAYAERAGGVLVGLHPTHHAARPDFAAATVEATVAGVARALAERARGNRASLAHDLAAGVGSGVAARRDLLVWARSSARELADFAVGAAEAVSR